MKWQTPEIQLVILICISTTMNLWMSIGNSTLKAFSNGVVFCATSQRCLNSVCKMILCSMATMYIGIMTLHCLCAARHVTSLTTTTALKSISKAHHPLRTSPKITSHSNVNLTSAPFMMTKVCVLLCHFNIIFVCIMCCLCFVCLVLCPSLLDSTLLFRST